MTLILLGFLAFFSAWLSSYGIQRYAVQLHLIQVPNHRSSHTQATPHGGGIGIISGFLLISFWLLWQEQLNYPLFLTVIALALIIALTSLLDDLFHLSMQIRLVVHILASWLLLLGLSNLALYHSFNLFSLPEWAIMLCLVFVSSWWINLFNFMDGIDGLAATQAMFMLLAAGGLSFYQHPDIYQNIIWLWMCYLVAAIGGFLILNWSPASLFMGDVGSTFLAFMLIFFALISVYLHWLNAAVWIILAAVFVSDASITLIRRIVSRQAWTQAHRSHAYQHLARQWQSHQKVTLFYLLINLVWLLPLAYLASQQAQYQWYYVLLAYLPIMVLMYQLNAGK